MYRNQETNLPMNDTRETILVKLLSEDLTAIDLENELNINESAIRRHLNNLERQGYVEHYFEKAERGRPKKLYTLTREGRGLFPQKTNLLFILLAEGVRNVYGEEDLDRLLSQVADRFADRLTSPASDGSRVDQLKDFVDSLDKFGFYPSLEEKEEFYVIKYRNCVFGEVIEELCEQLCNMHKQIVNNVIPNCEVYLMGTRGLGDKICAHKIVFKD